MAVSSNWQCCCADRRAARESKLQRQEDANQHGKLGQTPLHCPGSHVAPRPDQLPYLWNNGSPGDNVISCLETALGYLYPLALAGLLWFPDKWTFSYVPYGACGILITLSQMTTEFTPLIYLSETKINSDRLFFQERHSFPFFFFFFSCCNFLGVNF